MTRQHSVTVNHIGFGITLATVWSRTGSENLKADWAAFFWPPFNPGRRKQSATEWAQRRANDWDMADAITRTRPCPAREALPSTLAGDIERFSPSPADVRQLVTNLNAIALVFEGDALHERLGAAVSQFITASRAPNNANALAAMSAKTAALSTKCDECGWALTTTDCCSESICPHRQVAFPQSMSHRSGHHERYVTGYNQALIDVRVALGQRMPLSAPPSDQALTATGASE
jgi:hypothetical protein